MVVVTAIYGGCHREERKIFYVSPKVREETLLLKSNLPNKLIQCVLVAPCLLKVQFQALAKFSFKRLGRRRDKLRANKEMSTEGLLKREHQLREGSRSC